MITNYGELKTEVQSWVNRDDAFFVSRIPDFVRMAEAEIYRDLRSDENVFRVTLAADDSPQNMKNPITLPDNFEELKLITVDDRPMQRISDQQYQRWLDITYDASDRPSYFATFERKLYLYPWVDEDLDVDSTSTIVIDYYGTESLTQMPLYTTPMNPNAIPESDGTPAAFTERTDAATTRLFLRYPTMYLHGALYFANLFLKAPDEAVQFKQLFEATNKDIHRMGRRSDYAGSTKTVRSAYP